MSISRILGGLCITSYLLAMFLPSIAYRNGILPGWEVTYLSGLFSFAESMELGDRAPFIVGTLANFLFLFGVTIFLGRVFFRWSWPHDSVTCSISATSLICSVVSVSIAGMLQTELLVGSYVWILSPTLLFLGSLFACWEQRNATELSGSK
jgi:hypothetical protein